MALCAAALAVAVSRSAAHDDIQVAHATAGHLTLHEQASVGLCPWRDPDHDRASYFPESTGIRDETLILSGKRIEVAQLLGRPATGEENALKVYRILKKKQVLGSVVARRVRGESGVIELLLAVNQDGHIVGAKLQRLREPDDVTRALQSPSWLGAFTGKNRASDWQLGSEIPNVPPAAQTSASAIVEAARTLLILLAVGNETHSVGNPHG